jgi:hypothetical protein
LKCVSEFGTAAGIADCAAAVKPGRVFLDFPTRFPNALPRQRAVVLLALALTTLPLLADGPTGYYRFPAIHGDTIVLTAEGDLWSGPVTGGLARRITTHPGTESHATISPDGGTLAFSAEYEGPTEGSAWARRSAPAPWGGEIWLAMERWLVDGGMASAAETGG